MRTVFLVWILLGWYQEGQVFGQEQVSACSPGEFACAITGTCIAEELYCDGNPDCSQGEDEWFCTPFWWSIDQFRCGSGMERVSRARLCDGIADCQDLSDEEFCDGGMGSYCEVNEFACSFDGPCIPLASLCDGVGNCPNSDDESRCEQPEVKVQLSAEMPIMAGDSISLSCEAVGYPPPFITWRKNLMPIQRNFRYNFTSQDGFGVLRIRDASSGDSGEYHCEVISRLHGSHLVLPGLQVQVDDSSPEICLDHNNQPYTEDTYYYDVRPVGVGPASQVAADVVFVVDESGSMAGEHAWISEEVGILDRLLKNRGVGAGERENLFALVGFGRADPSAILGITLADLSPPVDFVAASANLELTGGFEDGYSGIEHALDAIATRPDTARLMVLVTDEDRAVLKPGLSRDILQGRLRAAGYVLNVVVNQGFQTTAFQNTSFALGVSSDATYLFDPNATSRFSISSINDIIPSSEIQFGSTFEDYVELALGVGGAAWDLNQLREGGLLARGFTNAFSEGKVEEVMTIFSFCFECLCRFLSEVCTLAEGISIDNCTGTFPVLESVVTPERAFVKSGNDVTFQCLAFTNFANSSVRYEWSYPPQLDPRVTVDGSVLVLQNADLSAEVNFTCTVVLEGTALVAMATSTLVIDTRCQLPDWSYLVLGDVRLVLGPQGTNVSRAADIIVLVDESGSMTEEHAWIPTMATLLDQALRDVGVGEEPKNRFGVVGFGDDCNEGTVMGRVLLSSVQEPFAFADNITDFTRDLNIGGREEDGYSAIGVAMDSYTFRDVAKQFILVTDEDRDTVSVNLTKEGVRMLLEDAGIQLNAAISEEFEGGGGLRALGIDGLGNAYVYDPSIRSSFEVLQGSGMSVVDSAYGSTNADYTQLALELGGAAWDLSQLRQGGGVAEAFTNAFVQVKVLEIQSQLSRCLNCTCSVDGSVCNALPNANFSFCLGVPGPPAPGEEPLAVRIEGQAEVIIMPSETRSFTCRANASAVIRWTFNGGNLPSNAGVSNTGGYKAVLTIDGVLADNAGTYSCVAHSQSGAFRDSASILTLFHDPEQDLMLLLSPLQPVVTRGDNATISCNVQSPSTFSWMFDDGPLPLNAMILNNPNSTSILTLVAVEDDNTGAYTCTADSVDRNIRNQDTAYVEVTDPMLRLVVSPDFVTAPVGAGAELTCRVDCFCPGVIAEWSRSDGAPLSDMSVVTTSDDAGGGSLTVLEFPVTSSQDGGRYLCTAELEGSMVTAEAYLDVSGESFTLRILGQSSVEIEEGSSHSVVCQANQNASSITWTFDGEAVQEQGGDMGSGSEMQGAPSNVVSVVVSQMRAVLSILEANPLNSGPYQCTAVSDDGRETTASVDVTIQ